MLKIILFILLSVNCFGEVHYPTAESIHSEADQAALTEQIIEDIALCKEEVIAQYMGDLAQGLLSLKEYRGMLKECETDAM